MDFLIKFWKSFIWAAIIAFALLTPGNKLPKKEFLHFENFDKIVHFGMFLVLQFLFFLEYQGKSSFRRSGVFLITAVIGLSYGGLMEILQTLITHEREASIFDLIADLLGIIAAWPMLNIFYSIRYQFLHRNL